MNIKRLLLILISSLFVLQACNKEEEYPVTFEFLNQVNQKKIIGDNYNVLNNDSTLTITGIIGEERIIFTMLKDNEDKNPLLTVGYYDLSDPRFSLEYMDSDSIISTAESGYFNITYINFYMNFNFEAVLNNTYEIKQGIGKHIDIYKPNTTIQEPENPTPTPVDTFDPPPIDTGFISAAGDGLFANIVNYSTSFDLPISDLDLTYTDTSMIVYGYSDSLFRKDIKIEILKPYSDHLGVTYSLIQDQQTKIKMLYREENFGWDDYIITEGEIQVIDLNVNTISFVFYCTTQDPIDTTFFRSIDQGYGKNIPLQ